jgi:putative holliday junction resolvase
LRRLGLDIGEVRTGVAVSDPTGRVSTPLTVLDARVLARDARPLARLVDDYEADLLVVGLPLSLDGSEGPQAVRVREIAERLARALSVPLEFWDERLTSAEAERAMASAGVGSRRRRGAVDAVAASIMLQSYLDANRPTDGSEGSDD